MERIRPPFTSEIVDEESTVSPEKTEREKWLARVLELVEKIKGETFTFPGIRPEVYLNMKAVDDEFPGFTTPTDEIIARCQNEGIKIVLGDKPESGNVFVLPVTSDNIEMDGIISPYQLIAENVTNEYLTELIRLAPKKEKL